MTPRQARRLRPRAGRGRWAGGAWWAKRSALVDDPEPAHDGEDEHGAAPATPTPPGRGRRRSPCPRAPDRRGRLPSSMPPRPSSPASPPPTTSGSGSSPRRRRRPGLRGRPREAPPHRGGHRPVDYAHLHPRGGDDGTWSSRSARWPGPTGLRRLPRWRRPELTLGVDITVPGDHGLAAAAAGRGRHGRRVRSALDGTRGRRGEPSWRSPSPGMASRSAPTRTWARSATSWPSATATWPTSTSTRDEGAGGRPRCGSRSRSRRPATTGCSSTSPTGAPSAPRRSPSSPPTPAPRRAAVRHDEHERTEPGPIPTTGALDQRSRSAA